MGLDRSPLPEGTVPASVIGELVDQVEHLSDHSVVFHHCVVVGRFIRKGGGNTVALYVIVRIHLKRTAEESRAIRLL